MAKTTGKADAPATKKAVKKAAETKEIAPKVRAQRKAAPVTTAPAPVAPVTEKNETPYDFKQDAKAIPEPTTESKIFIATVDGKFLGQVIGVHEGLRIDVIVNPGAPDANTLGCVEHKSLNGKKPYWEYTK